MHTSRRKFLKAATVAGAALTLRDSFLHPLAAAKSPGFDSAAWPTWVDRPMRWAQLTLVEDDPGKIGLQFWLWPDVELDAHCQL